ncbi:uncharacterized protein LOC121193950 [Toxotes jaculatrix]|uniref:uncharacterized protein LOC121193950 n=1 Tax=Toxotes jaculatrix TaxID=941984 RepID=UPI001B3AB537|nr:uncharacterized protein LOC121193950 [Toxotes jaculatrix]
MVIMVHLDQATLLFIQLFLVHHVFAGTSLPVHRNVLVSRGEDVTIICNISENNTTQISWTKGRFLFAYSGLQNLNFSNFTSDRLRIDPSFPLKLIISNTQLNDAGIYRCNVNGRGGPKTAEWNLTVSEEPEEIIATGYFPYILPPVTGLLLCGIASAVCLCRKCKTRTPNQDPDQDHFHHQSEEAVLSQQQADTNSRITSKRRSQFIERINSVYGLY